MVGELTDLITGEQVAVWLIIALLVGYFIYKEFPEFRKRISNGALKEKDAEFSEKTIIERLDAIEAKLSQQMKKIDEMDDKLLRDYDRINSMEKEQKALKRTQKASLEERGIIMRALLALMEGLPDNELVHESEREINEYLIKQAHQEEEI